ncbi:hypothetical protein J1N35_011537 [Gossypium stocksii]|uniref:RNase H type-1 domain-containing protein n=1 Tax=Gossypium stocksii TaxID=47602 RepID=A0A9D3W278_9ROSI|nr:hypothetical protein J1N35_011537 [Gossypium stocksii]
MGDQHEQECSKHTGLRNVDCWKDHGLGKINRDATPNTPMDQRYGDLLRMRVVDNLDNYLRLPLFVGKKKSMAFHSILNSFSCRINSWSKRLLSDGDKFGGYSPSTLTIGGFNGRLLDKDYLCCIDWIEDVMHLLDKKVVLDFISILWHNWNNRNNYVFRGKEDEARVIWERAKTLCQDFLIYNMGFKDEDMTVDWAELYALEESLNITCSLNIPNAIFETDCASLTNWVKKCREDITIIRYHIKEILKTMEMFNNAAVNWINRSCNNATDFIYKYALINDCTLVFGMDYPKEIHDLVIDDSIN